MIRPAPQRGYILLPVIVVITLVAAIALLMNTESAIESNTAGTELDAQQAQYVAEAGLNHGLWLSQQQGCGPYSNLTDEPLGNDKYSTSLTTDLGSTNTVTITVDQDSWIRSDLPTENKAVDLKLHTRNETLGTERPLLRYDLSPIAAKASILSATAWFYITNAHAAGPIDIHLTSADWTETDATWDSMNANMDSAVLATIPSQPVTGLWLPVNLTAQVQAWVNGQPNFGITLNSTVDGVHGQYNSRESANPPYLEVVVGTPPASPALLKAVGTLANGVTRKVERTDVTLVQHPAGFSLSRVTTDSGQDAMLDSFYSNRDYGVHELEVSLGSGSTLEHSLLQFELPAIAPGARIISARLDLFHYVTTRSTGNLVVDVHRVTRSWVEGTHDGTGTADGATWDTWDGSSSWSSAGGDYASASVASTAISAITGDWESFEIGDLVQGWIDGNYPNHGLLLKGAGDFDISFASKEDADAALHPKLSITYACECGQVCVAPQGSGNLLMVVVNPTTLVAEDQQAKDLFESWGYTVSVISESDNQATFDTAFAANDVVFISETVNAMQVGVKTASAPIGVVSQDGDYNSDLGLASGSALKVGGSIDIVSTDHYITRPFSVGTHRIYSADMEQAIVSGSLTADQQTLAEIGGDGSLVVLDQGDAMEGGGNAAGRRVILPLGTRYNFNWDYLNANGRLLVQRALAWGIGAGNTSTGDVLLVVVDPGLLSSQEDAKKALIESWGYTVNPIGEAASQAEFDAAVALNDVVYVAEDITSGTLGTKLRDAAIGVVIEEEKITDEFGIASGETTLIETSIEITDNTHYITQPFSLGVVAFASSAQPVGGRGGTLAPGLEILALQPSGSTSMLDVIDTGGALFDTGTAAGRRVKLPWGGNDFDINSLTDDGRTIMRRAIEWGAIVAPPPLSQQLLFVVPSPGSLGPTDTAKQALFESWGYTVNQIDDDAPLSDYQAAIGANGLTYVSSTAVPASVGSKLFKAPIGVVNANTGLHDDFGFSTMRYISSTNAGLNTVANHYITQPFGGGQATLYTSDQPSGGAVGTLAADLDQIGSWSSGALSPLGGLVTLDAGAMTSIGENTPGRRAQMPWDNLDPSTLSADGLTILRRSLEWAEGANIDLSPFAHWKLDETTGPMAVDSEGDNHGTWTNGPVPAPGVDAGGLDFDGSNDYVDVGSFDVTGSGITMMGWFNAEALTTADERIISKAAGTAEADAWWQLSSSNSGADRFLRMRIKAGGTTTTLADSSVNLDTGTWYLAAATYDNASGVMRLYVDGVEVASITHAVGGTLDSNPAVPVALGANGTAERVFNGVLDDIRVYNRALGASEIQDYYDASAPQAPGYTEVYEPWSALSDSNWEVVDLASFGVPANAVIEVVIVNADAGKEQWGGVRAVGSVLERRVLLHEPESGGVDSVTMHVQADASGRIEHYTSKKGTTSFVLLGYWTGTSYAELFEPFTANAVDTWVEEDVGDDGVGVNQVAEILIMNNNGSAERLAGVRASGATHQRRFMLHEAESGGVDALTLMVATDASSIIEVYSDDTADIEFYVLGTWSTPPGSYTESGGVHGQVSALLTWETNDLSSFGVPAASVVQFVVTNEADGAEVHIGVRETASTLQRVLDLQEAEGGGSDAASMHVNVDGSAQVEWYSEYGGGTRFFYPVGWWVLSP